MRPNPKFPTDLVTFTEEILNGKIHFLCSVLVALRVTSFSWWCFPYMIFTTICVATLLDLMQNSIKFIIPNTFIKSLDPWKLKLCAKFYLRVSDPKITFSLLIPVVFSGYFFRVGVQKKVEMELDIKDVWY